MTREFRPAAARAPGVPADRRGMEPGIHLIALHHGEAELTRAAGVFVRATLAAGDRVLYLASERPLTAARTVLEASDAAAGPAIAAGQLVLRSLADLCGGTGRLDLAAPASELRAAVHLARTEGFPGLRVAAEMGGFTRMLGSIEQILAWERMATVLQREEGISLLCQYDQQRLGGEFSGLLAAEHGGAAPQSAPPPPASFLATPRGLRLTGEVDVANREGFIRAVRARLASIPQLTLDVGELAFMDAGTLGELHLIATGLPPDGRITLARPSRQLQRLAAVLGGWPHPRLMIEPAR